MPGAARACRRASKRQEPKKRRDWYSPEAKRRPDAPVLVRVMVMRPPAMAIWRPTQPVSFLLQLLAQPSDLRHCVLSYSASSSTKASPPAAVAEIGRASCRERVCQYV